MLRAMSGPTHSIILAAGRGSRLGLEGEHLPKPLQTVGGEPLIVRLCRQIIDAGIVNITVVLGYDADRIKKLLLSEFEQSADMFTFVMNERYAYSNNILSLLVGLQSSLHSTSVSSIVVAECDIYLRDGIISELNSVADRNVALISPYASGMDGTVVTLKETSINAIIQGSEQDEFFDYRDTFKTVNIYRFSESFCRTSLLSALTDHVESGGINDYYEHILASLVGSGCESIRGMIVDSQEWSEIDDLNDLRKARMQWSPACLESEVAHSHGGYWDTDLVDFSFIRNMYFPSESLMAQLRLLLSETLINYGSSQSVLNQKMGWWLNKPSEEVLALAGLSAIYPLLKTEFGRKVVIQEPTFGEYGRNFPEALTLQPDDFLEKVESICRHEEGLSVFIVNPNNPTGHCYRTDQIVEMASAFPGSRFFVDESFIAFSEESSVLTYENIPKNIIALGSLGKALGVPGLRLGYLVTQDRDLHQRLGGQLPVWAINSLAERFLELILKFRPDFHESLRRSFEDREQFRMLLGELDSSITVDEDTQGNFLLVNLSTISASDSERIWRQLLDRGFLVKDISHRMNRGHAVFRVAVRQPEDNGKFASSLVKTVADSTFLDETASELTDGKWCG